MFKKKNLRGNLCNVLMAVGIVVSSVALSSNSALFWGESELPLDLREKK